MKFIAYWLKKHMRPMNNERHSITFRYLYRILCRYGYSLENPENNYIDVMWEREETKENFLKKPSWSSRESVVSVFHDGC